MIVWFASLVLLTLLSSLIPPLQSPDEPAHLGRAYVVSRGSVFLETPPGQDSGGVVDSALLEYVQPLSENISLYARGLPLKEPNIAAHWNDASPGSFVNLAGTGYYLPLIYAPQALGLWLGRHLDLSIHQSYYLVRFITLVCCCALLWGAMRLHTVPPLAGALLLMPMSMFQMLSPTIDGVSNALTVFILALFFSILRGHWGPRRELASLWLASCIVLLAGSRTHGLPLLALPLYLAWREKSARGWWRAGIAVVLVLAWVLFAMATTHDTRVVLNSSPAGLIRHYAFHPFAFVGVVWNSVTDPGLSEFYTQSFIGQLGWLDTLLSPAEYTLLTAGLLVAALASFQRIQGREDLQVRGLLLVIAAASVALVFLSMLVTWTPHPATLIQGVQGRYFLLPALVFAHALGGPAPVTLSRSRWVLAGFGAFSVAILLGALLNRYH